MFDMRIALSEDQKELSLELPDMSQALKMSATELDEVIRHLAWVRASMQPEHAPKDPTHETPVSAVPARRWFVTEDAIQGQARLHLLHPGFGWLWIPLDLAAFENLSRTARLFLQTSSSKH